MRKETNCVHGKRLFDEVTGAISVPIYQSAAFRHPGPGESTGYDYSRALNPTRSALEETMALLEGGKYGLAFATGMGAVSTAIKIFEPGAHLIVSEDLYGGTYRLFNGYYSRYGYSFSWVDTGDLEKVKAAFKPNTRGVFIETPSNPMMRVSDIAACAALIHERGGYLLTDNTFLTPYFQNPLALGADFVIHSGTKYLGGHNDTLAGFLIHSNDGLEEALREIQKSEGASLSPFDSWLLLRGIKTLALRMKKHEANGKAVAEFLRSHPRVEKVYYTGFADHPQAALSAKQSRGFNGMISFSVKDSSLVDKALKRVKLILFAESLGGVESLITFPLVQTHGAIPPEMREATGINDRLLRISVGIEDVNDIIEDLEQALSE